MDVKADHTLNNTGEKATPNAWSSPPNVADLRKEQPFPPMPIPQQHPPQIVMSDPGIPPTTSSWVPQQTSKPRPRAGYRCKICGMPGGLPDSHWFQLCPKGNGTGGQAHPTINPPQNFQPPKSGYVCKYCNTPGGRPDSHWFQQCPNLFQNHMEGHPLSFPSSPMMVPSPYDYAMSPTVYMPPQMYYPVPVEENSAPSSLSVDPSIPVEMHNYLVHNVLVSPAGPPATFFFSHQLAQAMGTDKSQQPEEEEQEETNE